MSGIITVVPASSGDSGASRLSHWIVLSSTPKTDARVPIGVGVCSEGFIRLADTPMQRLLSGTR